MGSMFQIRPEAPRDSAPIHAVHAAAFPTDAEARLVGHLRDANRLSISLVAIVGNGIVGHVAFSPVMVDTIAGGLGLAPVGVLPAFQQRGIGSRLIEEGLAHARAVRVPFVVLLGAPAYYARFGFGPASAFGLRDEYGGGSAFQVIELIEGAIPKDGGLVRYAPEFALVE
jgi:putative acetyltransferase